MPNLFLGVNFSTMSGSDSFPILGRLAREGVKVDAYWADNACLEHEMQVRHPKPETRNPKPET